MITHNLKIVSTKTKDFDTQQKVVVFVGWRLTAIKDEKTLSFDGQSIWDAPGEPFTPFEQLTEAQVMSWVEAVEPLDAHRASLEQQFNWNAPSDQEQDQPLPWAQQGVQP